MLGMFLREVVTGQRTAHPVRYAQVVESFRDDAGISRHRQNSWRRRAFSKGFNCRSRG